MSVQYEKAMNLADGLEVYTDLRDRIKDVVAVQNEEPTAEDAKIWIPPSTPQNVQVPTYQEFQEALENLPTGSVEDVQINGTSIVQNGIANIPVANSETAGVMIVKPFNGHQIINKILSHKPAASATVKSGTETNDPIVPSNQHESVFYGLAKVAGHNERNSSLSVGTYTPEAKGSIQSMLGVTDLIGTDESSLVASKAYAVGEVFVANGKMYVATSAIALNDAIVPYEDGISAYNCTETNLSEKFVKNTDVATTEKLGLIRPHSNSFTFYGDALRPRFSSISDIKGGSDAWKPLSATYQHASVFYGLAKAAGDATQSASSNAVGTYTPEAKSAIQSMLGVPGDVQINGTSIVTNGVANIPTADRTVSGTVKLASDYGIQRGTSGLIDYAIITPASSSKIKSADTSTSSTYQPITPRYQHESVFYGLSKLAGVDLANETVTVGTYPQASKEAIQSLIGVPGDVQVNGTSVVTNGVANVPVATGSVYGVMKVDSYNGVQVRSADGQLIVVKAIDSDIKASNQAYKPIVPSTQDKSVFYGLAKVAGHDEKNSTLPVGTYTPQAKNAIQSMLGVEPGVSFVEEITGTTATITGEANVRYICGELTELTITPPNNGTIVVRFTSGTTPTVLSIPSTVKFPDWVDLSTLEASTTYEIMITDGVYGGVMTWAG